MPQLPRKLTANDPHSVWCNAVVDYLRSLTPATSPGTFTTHAPHGVVRKVAPWSRTASDIGSTVQQFRFKSINSDYLTCRTYDAITGEGGIDIYIAKPFKLRNPASEVIDGVTVSYSSYSGQTRLASDGVNPDETQVINPRYLVDDLIYAVTVDHTGVTVSSVELVLIDINTDGRAWAKIDAT
jgi:hypothetical protein